MQTLRFRRRDPQKATWGFNLLIAGHHFINYARTVTAELEEEIGALGREEIAPDLDPNQNARDNPPVPGVVPC